MNFLKSVKTDNEGEALDLSLQCSAKQKRIKMLICNQKNVKLWINE